ncbi:hypothetical protein SAMN05443248_7560 [Bradyrhizobium erythrophlei]|uniref:Uncharacterized protein n=1 Tax=Bradyrhizobium erythrophlei TaxID=1437360 RepID=A0A1M5XRN2_9BRAD|nr:hypothetical protein SAMN05443248_7560 [Bradyrhizobium erythrophlei]
MRQSIAPLRRTAMQAATVQHPTLWIVAHARIAPAFWHVAHVRVLECEKFVGVSIQPLVPANCRPPRVSEKPAGPGAKSLLLARRAGVHIDFHADRHFNDLGRFPGHDSLLRVAVRSPLKG